MRRMTPHEVIVKAWHGALTGVLPAVLVDAGIVYRWTKQDEKTFLQMFDWRVAGKNLIGGMMGGVVGAFGLSLAGVQI